jgi:nitroimidazol reductase NimA-like FMN-containing flavoprotein (pyridoxamine 5'-phosphate oxidase superfamily)
MTDRTLSDPAGSYPIGAANRVRRAPNRAHYDRATIWSILDAAMLCHVAYVLDGRPYATPTTHWRIGDVLYWHGSAAGQWSKRLADDAGLPVCVTVSHLDGLVLARSGFDHSINYRSAMCFGTARAIADEDEKRAALTGMIERFFPGRAATLRPIDERELRATMVIAMPIDAASAKVRAAGVGGDEADLGVATWAGVLPIHTVVGVAEPCPRGSVTVERPAGLDAYRAGRRLDEALLETEARWEAAPKGDAAEP